MSNLLYGSQLHLPCADADLNWQGTCPLTKPQHSYFHTCPKMISVFIIMGQNNAPASHPKVYIFLFYFKILRMLFLAGTSR